MFNTVTNEALTLKVFPSVLLSLKPMKNVCLGMGEHMVAICEALDSNPSSTKGKQNFYKCMKKLTKSQTHKHLETNTTKHFPPKAMCTAIAELKIRLAVYDCRRKAVILLAAVLQCDLQTNAFSVLDI